MKTVKTSKGTSLPLTNLKGKDYLQVAYRLQWFVEENPRYVINTEFLVLNDEQTVAKATIQVMNEQGQIVRQAVATKRETKKDFSDHTEKAETGSLGRALIELGYGTQYALSDLDEGARIVDSPLVDVKASAPKPVAAAASAVPVTEAATPVSEVKPMQRSSFRSRTKTEQVAIVAAASAAIAANPTPEDWS